MNYKPFYLLLLLPTFAVTTSYNIKIDDRIISITNPTYVSWNVDSSGRHGIPASRGFFEIHFDNAHLRYAAHCLGPSTLRFGGSGNDFLRYELPPDFPCQSSPGSTYGCLNMTHWDNLFGLADGSEYADAELLFGISFDLATAQAQGLKYAWNSSNAEKFIKYLIAHNQTVYGFELGNEINNSEKEFQLEPTQQAQAFLQLKEILERLYPDPSTRPVMIGPDTGYYNSQSYLQGFLESLQKLSEETTETEAEKKYLNLLQFNSRLPLLSRRDRQVSEASENLDERRSSSFPLHAVTHHVYPSITRENYNSPSKLDHRLQEISWFTKLVRQYAPQSQIWAGEDGPISGGPDGTCDQKGPSVCGTYSTVLWYADDLAMRAQYGFKQYQRQDLLGGAYGLLSIPSGNMALSKTDGVFAQPDYFIALLFKRLMGTRVLNATATTVNASNAEGNLRVYTHCSATPLITDSGCGGISESRLGADAERTSSGNALTLLLINLSDNDSQIVNIPEQTEHYMKWTLTPDDGGVFDRYIQLNGVKINPNISAEHPQLPNMRGQFIDGHQPIELPPVSVTFLVVYGLNITSCM